MLNSQHSWVAAAQGTVRCRGFLSMRGKACVSSHTVQCKAACEKRLHTDAISAINLWLCKRKSLAANHIPLKCCHSNYKHTVEGKVSVCLTEGRGFEPRAPTSPWIYCTLRSYLKCSVSGRWPLWDKQMHFMSCKKKTYSIEKWHIWKTG